MNELNTLQKNVEGRTQNLSSYQHPSFQQQECISKHVLDLIDLLGCR